MGASRRRGGVEDRPRSWTGNSKLTQSRVVPHGLVEGDWATALGNAGLITLAANGLYHATGVLPIQRAIADAWAAGINKDGEKKIRGRAKNEFVGSKGPKAAIGSCQAWAVFERLRIPVTTACFDEVDRVDKLYEAARDYFRMSGWRPHLRPPCALPSGPPGH